MNDSESVLCENITIGKIVLLNQFKMVVFMLFYCLNVVTKELLIMRGKDFIISYLSDNQ